MHAISTVQKKESHKIKLLSTYPQIHYVKYILLLVYIPRYRRGLRYLINIETTAVPSFQNTADLNTKFYGHVLDTQALSTC